MAAYRVKKGRRFNGFKTVEVADAKTGEKVQRRVRHVFTEGDIVELTATQAETLKDAFEPAEAAEAAKPAEEPKEPAKAPAGKPAGAK